MFKHCSKSRLGSRRERLCRSQSAIFAASLSRQSRSILRRVRSPRRCTPKSTAAVIARSPAAAVPVLWRQRGTRTSWITVLRWCFLCALFTASPPRRSSRDHRGGPSPVRCPFHEYGTRTHARRNLCRLHGSARAFGNLCRRIPGWTIGPCLRASHDRSVSD